VQNPASDSILTPLPTNLFPMKIKVLLALVSCSLLPIGGLVMGAAAPAATNKLSISTRTATERARELTERARQLTALEAFIAKSRAMKNSGAQKRARAEVVKTDLVGQPAPELNFIWSTRDGLTNLSDLKGKVVVIDFWTTACGPCVASFPEVRELTAHYEGRDVVVIGVTSLQGSVHGLKAKPIYVRNDPVEEMALMNDYINVKDITWTVVFSAEEVFNLDYGVAGIPHLVIIAPDGTVRHNGLDPAEPLKETTQRIDAILKEFGKPLPATSPK
jgi:thiol-disulfide isomerase/thioredoxin